MADRKTLAARFKADETVVTAWSVLPAPVVAEAMARAGFGAVTLDMQHGIHDAGSIRDCLAAVALGGAHRIVRIPVGGNAMASRAADAGAEAVIAPMINSAEDARAFAAAMKYPPLGSRSWGPVRASMLAGQTMPEYLAGANSEVLAFAMIETPEAVAALDEILAVPGIDGVFVGPGDLSLTLSNGAALNPHSEAVREAAELIIGKTRAAGRLAGYFCMTPEDVKAAEAMGYRLLAHGLDLPVIQGAFRDVLARLA